MVFVLTMDVLQQLRVTFDSMKLRISYVELALSDIVTDTYNSYKDPQRLEVLLQ